MRRYTETPFSILYVLLDILVSMLGARVVLTAVSARPSNAIVRIVHDATQPFVEPFRGVFRAGLIGGVSVDMSALAAIAFFVFSTVILMHFLGLLTQIVDEDESRTYHRGHRHRHA